MMQDHIFTKAAKVRLLLPCPECGSDLDHEPMCSMASPRKPGDPCDCAAMHAELTRLRAEVARLTPPQGCRWVAVAEELMAQMGEWSDPVRVKIGAVDERQVTLTVSRYTPDESAAERRGAERALEWAASNPAGFPVQFRGLPVTWNAADESVPMYQRRGIAALYPAPATDTQEPGTQKLYSGVDFWKDDQHPAKADTQGVPFCTSCGLRKAKCDGC